MSIIEAATSALPTDEQLVALAAELGAVPAERRFTGGFDIDDTPIAGSPQDQAVPDGVSNPYWEIVRHLPGDAITLRYDGRIEPSGRWTGKPESVMRRAHAAGLSRSALCARYAWSIPSPGDITWTAKMLDGRGVVEIGAGSGYWAWQLTQAGVDVIAYDPVPPSPDNPFNQHRLYHPVRNGDHEKAAEHPDRALMLCWPSYQDAFAKQALHHYAGDTVVYIGEGESGCCADDRFHRILNRDFEEIDSSPFHVTYWGIHCRLTAWRRKPKKAAQADQAPNAAKEN